MSTREGSSLDWLYVNREGLVEDETVGGCLGPRDPEMIEFWNCGEGMGGSQQKHCCGHARMDFGLFEGPADRVPREVVLKGKVVQEGRLFPKKDGLEVQE